MCKSPSLRARPSIGLKMCWQPCRRRFSSRIPNRGTYPGARERPQAVRIAVGGSRDSQSGHGGAFGLCIGPPTVQIEGPQLLLEPSAAQAIAVIVHELATNAAKCGALSVPKGRVQFEWSHAADGRLVIRWSESGGPPAKQPTHRGFGTRVMDGMIRGQLRGEMHLDWRPQGLACEIVLST